MPSNEPNEDVGQEHFDSHHEAEEVNRGEDRLLVRHALQDLKLARDHDDEREERSLYSGKLLNTGAEDHVACHREAVEEEDDNHEPVDNVTDSSPQGCDGQVHLQRELE